MFINLDESSVMAHSHVDHGHGHDHDHDHSHTPTITSDNERKVLLSFGLILVIDEAREILFGKDVHSVAPPAWLSGSIQLTDNLSYPVYRLAICGFCLVVAALIFFVITRTKIGMIVRAGADPYINID